MRSKQWYTKISRLENSFANNSIGRLLDFALATKSSVRRPVESNAPGGPGERRWITGEKEAGRRELAGGRARFPERPRGARPVSAALLRIPAEPDQNDGDLAPTTVRYLPRRYFRAAHCRNFSEQPPVGCDSDPAFPKTGFEDVVTPTVIPLPAPLELRCLEISNMFG